MHTTGRYCSPLFLVIFSLLAPTAQATNSARPIGSALDPNLPIYRPVANLEGTLKLGGANTLSHVAAVWIDGFKQFHPHVEISIEVNGSRQAIADVKDGTTDIGLLSRTIFPEEVADFEQTFGYQPTVLTPCMERTAIFVNKENPVKGLTLAQLDAIFSTTCNRGAEKHAATWGDVGLTGEWAQRKITAHGRTMDTGSQVFLRQALMLDGEMCGGIVQHKSNVEIVNAVASDPGSIGFGGLSYATPEVKAVPLAFSEKEGFVAIDSPEAARGAYPLIRRLQVVVNHDPAKKLSPVEEEFLKYVFSRVGQEDVVKAGFQPIPAPPARVALNVLGLGSSR